MNRRETLEWEGFRMTLNVKNFAFTVGLFWAFPDGIIGGAIFAWLYNMISEKIKTN